MKNKRNYGRYLSLFFPDLEKTNQKKYYNFHGHEITKSEYKRLVQLKEEIENLTKEYNELNQ